MICDGKQCNAAGVVPALNVGASEENVIGVLLIRKYRAVDWLKVFSHGSRRRPVAQALQPGIGSLEGATGGVQWGTVRQRGSLEAQEST